MSAVHPTINLVVLRCADIHASVVLYRAIGLVFKRESHGGPEHYSAQLADCVFEIYPLKPGAKKSNGARLGFAVRELVAILAAVVAAGGTIIESADDGRAVVEDLDGHRIELTALEP